MRKLKIGILDLVANRSKRTLWSRTMNPNFANIMPLAYALSNFYRAKGAMTVLGGPHARCYPEDAAKYFDYVLGFTDKTVIHDLLQDCSQYRPIDVHLSANKQPTMFRGV